MNYVNGYDERACMLYGQQIIHPGQTPKPNRGYCMRRYRLPYWAFMPTLGVWPGVDGNGTGSKRDATAIAADSLLASKSVAVNLDSGKVTVVDRDRFEVTADAVTPKTAPAAFRAVPAADLPKRRKPTKAQQPNTPSVGGPSWLRRTTTTTTTTSTSTEATTTTVSVKTKNSAEVIATPEDAATGPVTRIYLKPSARAKAGAGGVALSNPISTAVVRRGDTVRIEYLPDATAETGEGGVAISRPELIIQFVD